MSAFPEPAVFNWSYPWFGGLQPEVQISRLSWTDSLEGETFSVDTVIRRDERGVEWTGVCQRASLSKQETQGLALEIEILTVGGSPIIKIVWRLRNMGTVLRRLRGGLNAFVQPDGESRDTLLSCDGYLRKRSAWSYQHLGGHWSAATNPRTGRTITLVSALNDVRMNDWGNDGGHLALMSNHVVPANSEAEMIAYLALTDSQEEASRFAALKDFN